MKPNILPPMQVLKAIQYRIGFSVYLTLLLAMLSLTACQSQSEEPLTPKFSVAPKSQTIEYAFAVHPLHNPTRLFEVFNPLMEYLNAEIPNTHFRLEASRDYASFNQKIENGTVEFALPNPYQTLIAIDHHYTVFAKMGDDFNFRGIILVRKDSNIQQPKDLKGKVISYPAPTALAATMLPQYFLQTHGLDINKDVKNNYVGSQESAIMNVFVGDSAAGATWPPPWEALSAERPELKEQLKIIWQTQTLPNNSLMARDDIPEAVVQQVKQLVINLPQSEKGRQILQKMYLSQYEAASNETYQPVREFIRQFSERIRPL